MNKEMYRSNFTKLTQKKGISLIVLIVTIIVIIILAAVAILNISKNNPVNSAKEARFKEDVRSFQDDLSLSISKDYTAKAGQRNGKFSATTFDEMKNYIPSFTKEYEGKLVIKDDELKYSEDLNENEKTWLNDLGIKENARTAAEKVAKDTSYYGESITNYTANGVSDWKIFYSDGNNVYLIASDYVDVDKLPSTTNNSNPKNINIGCPKAATFTNVINDYNGSDDITDEKIKKLNNDYFSKGYKSTESNMKAVAYMLDINVWSSFKTDKAEYAIGGPTIEMLMASYSKKYNVKYIARAKNYMGYEISNDNGLSWVEQYTGMLKMNDYGYVLPVSKGAIGAWIASPSARDGESVMYMGYAGDVGGAKYNNDRIAFRPIVCLKSNVLLEKDEDGYSIN